MIYEKINLANMDIVLKTFCSPNIGVLQLLTIENLNSTEEYWNELRKCENLNLKKSTIIRITWFKIHIYTHIQITYSTKSHLAFRYFQVLEYFPKILKWNCPIYCKQPIIFFTILGINKVFISPALLDNPITLILAVNFSSKFQCILTCCNKFESTIRIFNAKCMWNCWNVLNFLSKPVSNQDTTVKLLWWWSFGNYFKAMAVFNGRNIMDALFP